MRRLAALLLSAGLIGGCGESAPPSPRSALPAPQGTTPATEVLKLGRDVYNFRCYFCHGYSGDARTLAATYLTPPPRDFTAATMEALPLARIEAVVRDGVPGTAMKGFTGLIPDAELTAVSAFVFDEFVRHKRPNTRYHTEANGWPNHDRYRAAYPFARGELSVDTPWDALNAEQQAGKRLYLAACVSCHDRGKPVADPVTWESRAISYPRNNYDHRNPEVDATTSATPYRLHDVPPKVANLSPEGRRGERLFQDNCAFCHAPDGTGKNWIGAFLEPHPRDLTDPAFMTRIDRAHLRRVIRDGLPETSMPAWKSVLDEREIAAIITYIDSAFHPVRP